MPNQQRFTAIIRGPGLAMAPLCRRMSVALGAAVAMLLPLAAPALAQQPAGGAQIVVQERIPYVESLVVAALFGAALFAVCRSSRRN